MDASGSARELWHSLLPLEYPLRPSRPAGAVLMGTDNTSTQAGP